MKLNKLKNIITEYWQVVLAMTIAAIIAIGIIVLFPMLIIGCIIGFIIGYNFKQLINVIADIDLDDIA